MAKNVYSTNAVLGELAKGELVTGTAVTTGQTLTADTELNLFAGGSATERVVYPYVSIAFGVQCSTNQLYYSWYVYRKRGDSIAVNFSDADTLEEYMKDKKILDRGFVIQPWVGAADMKVVKRVYFNVGLEPDEYLLITLLPHNSSGAGTVTKFIKDEERQVTIAGA